MLKTDLTVSYILTRLIKSVPLVKELKNDEKKQKRTKKQNRILKSKIGQVRKRPRY